MNTQSPLLENSVSPSVDDNRPRIVCTNKEAMAYNLSRMSALPGPPVTFYATDEGDVGLLRSMSKEQGFQWNPDTELWWRRPTDATNCATFE